jgi:hypothetical protein
MSLCSSDQAMEHGPRSPPGITSVPMQVLKALGPDAC